MGGGEKDLFQETFQTLSEDEKRRARRYSTGSTVSRYLRPSPGSCHDFCKHGNKETLLDVKREMSYRRVTTKLSGGHGSEGEIPSIGLMKGKPKANNMNLAARGRKMASSSPQPKSTMQSYLASSPGALKPKCTRTAPRVPSKSRTVLPKIKPIIAIRTKKSVVPSINSAPPPKAKKKNKVAQSGGENKDVQGEELYSDSRKAENEATESTNSLIMPSFSNIHENGNSCKFSDFTEADEVEATEVEDEAQMNRSADNAEATELEDETQINQSADDAEATEVADEPQMNQSADDAEATEVEDEAQMNRSADDGEATEVEDEAQMNRSADDAEATEVEDEAQINQSADDTEATEVEDEAQMNRSAEDAYRAENINLERKKVNGNRSLIPSPCPRRLKFRSHPDTNEQKDSGYSSDPGSMKVALRHWQLQEKKAARILLNDIIEETAVKLRRTQKNKVKALVGAFETIISLQEVEPSANIGK